VYYRIRVRGHLDDGWSAWFDGLAVRNLDGGDALLEGDLADQAALHGVLARVRDLGLPLLAVNQVEAGGAPRRDGGPVP
jgi:hypothetical protein